MTTDDIIHDEDNVPSLEQRLRAKMAKRDGFESFFRVHPDGDMTDAECAQVPTLEELLDSPKRLAAALLFVVKHLDDGDITLTGPIGQILGKQ